MLLVLKPEPPYDGEELKGSAESDRGDT